MKEERSILKDQTISNLKKDLDKQYYDHLDEMDRIKQELDDAKDSDYNDFTVQYFYLFYLQ